MLLGFVALLSLMLALPQRGSTETPAFYAELSQRLPDNAKVMINDPARLFYYTGFGGVVLPNEAPDAILEIAQKYGIDYVVIEEVGQGGWAVSEKLLPMMSDPPEFLREIDLDTPGVRLYAINDV